MKFTITLIALLSGISSAYAQVAFPIDNAKWKQRHGNGEASPTYSLIGTKTTDVTIDGITYRKLYESFDDNVFTESEYIGGIREASGGKIYFRGATASAEKLIYDFSVAVGDTITDAITNIKSGIVYSIDYVTIGGISRKRITFRQQSSSAALVGGQWIEGIGNSSIGGLLGSPMLQPTCDCGIKTVCLSVEGTSVYENQSFTDIGCDLLTFTETIFKPIQTATVVPNPVKGMANIIMQDVANYDYLIVSDLSGRIVFKTAVGGEKQISINTNQYAQGMYIYQLTGQDGQITGKFLVN